ncbi:hypothetical protein VX159_07070 [Dechloromonas sp. ZY10]|uniref:hypothetical protein n=1 Tax=Dechloromonas aquae TaxID=2664436 RepID=UPI0035279B17
MIAVATGIFFPTSSYSTPAVVQPDQAYACTSLTRQPDSLNYVERLFAKDGTYLFAWSRTEGVKNAITQRRGEHGEWVSFGRWKVIPKADGGSTLEVSEDVRYRYSDRSWHLPQDSTQPDRAFVTETVSLNAGGNGFDSKVGGRDYFTCAKRPDLTADKLELWRNVMPQAIEAKNSLGQRVSNQRQVAAARDTAQRDRYPGMNPQHVAEQELMQLQRRIVENEAQGLPPKCQAHYSSLKHFYTSSQQYISVGNYRDAANIARVGIDRQAQGCP